LPLDLNDRIIAGLSMTGARRESFDRAVVGLVAA
jgi:hypothetical protein